MAASGPSSRELIGLGASVAGSVVLGLVVGYLLDGLWDTSPALLFAGLAIGVVGAATMIALQVRRFAKADSEAEKHHPEEGPSCKEALG
ncbi:MAG: AtpZ/AtpI family protein [Segniliparus sp.]|uniref:AtpZ/AtpI family protein n=1 Tax=Segniliparus sp. TaxID=2804064 RepID=UPI003F2BCFCA